MVSIGEIEKVRDEIDKKLKTLRNLNEEYKKAIDRCYPAGISSKAYFIAKAEDDLHTYKDHFTIYQEEELDYLEREYVLNFQKLDKGDICECKPRKK